MIQTPDLLPVALQHHQAGRTTDAEHLYRQILRQQPERVEALNFLGALMYQLGRFDEAAECFEQVLVHQPNSPDAYNSVGIARKAQGQLEEAVDFYQRALELRPEHPEVLNNLGNVLKDLGRIEAAIATYETALTLRTDYPELHNNLGVLRKEQGNLEAAISHYRQALTLKPDYPEAHHNLGVALRLTRQFEDAEHYLRQAIALKPDYIEAHIHLGNTLNDQGNVEAAIAHYEAALKLKPTSAEAYNCLGNACQQQGQLDAAIAHYRQALELRPDYPQALNNLGNLLLEQGDADGAIAIYQQALEQRPDYPEVYNNLGNAVQDNGDLDTAMAHYHKALELRPDFAEAHSNLGAALKERKQYAEAIQHFQRAIELRPTYAEVHNNLGNAYQELGNIEAAIACYQTALAHNPKLAEVHSNLGNMLQQMGQFEVAFGHFEQALALQPDFAGAYNNRGIALRNAGRVQEAFAAYERAIALKPDFIEAHWNKALNHLLLGDFEQGFAGYEWRLQWSKFKEQNPPREFGRPQWDGSPLADKTLFLYAEQGMGDTIQFVRYAPILAAQGARVILECHPPLVNLLQGVAGVDQVIPQGALLPDFDVHLSLLSLPHRCGTTLDTVPAAIPYLTLPTDLPRTTLPAAPAQHLKIGIVWSGNPDNPYNRSRAVPLADLLALADLPNVTLYSLQKEPSAAELELLNQYPNVHDLHEQLTDFVHTAALIQQLDQIISVDTAVTHLAGALGQSVWLLLPYAPDWRWMIDRTDSPWYPSLRLFRQSTYGDWDTVLEQVHAALVSQLPAATKHRRPKPKKRAAASRPAPPTPSLPLELKTAIRHHNAGRVREAEQLCRDLLQRQSGCADAWHLLGLIAQQERRLDDAIAHYRQVLNLNPEHYDTYNNLAVALHEQRRFDDAITNYEKVLALKPDYADAHNNYANALREKDRLQDAIRHYQLAIDLKPEYADAHNNLGLAYFADGNYPQAIEQYRLAVAYRPEFAAAYNHLGNALKEVGEFEAAAEQYRRAIELKPGYANAYNNWGNVFREVGDLETAIQYYDRATELEPNFAKAHWNKALTLLLGGDLRRGFEEYEWRWHVKLPTFSSLRPFPRPLWDGSPLRGQTIFLHAEQGMGDVLQFVRYVPLVAQRGGRIILECHTPLVELLRSLPGVEQIVPYGSPLPPSDYDVQAPLLSLPHIFGTSLETVPNAVPYLSLPADVPLTLPEAAANALKVGLVWSGNPQNPYNRTRAVPLAELLPLTEIPGIQLYSLQKEPAAEDLDWLQAHPQIYDLRHALTDFVQTAAILQQLDCVISVDTAVTHLAGALGRPVWLLLPFAPDWRWMLHRTDSPWYPTMRLFRQSNFGDWDPVIADVREALLAVAADAERPQQTVVLPTEPLVAPGSLGAEHSATAIAQQLATALHHYRAGRLTEAEMVYRQVLRTEPEQLDALHTLAVILCQAQRYRESMPLLERVLALQPNWAEAWSNLGVATQEQGDAAAAIPHYERALALNPNFAEALQNLVRALQDTDRWEASITYCDRLLALRPDYTEAYANRGFALRRLGRLPDAIATYRQAIERDPTFVDAHKNLGHALLLTGDYAAGFAEYEWRWRQKHWTPRPFTQPDWDGSDLAGKTVLLHAEQGFGDTIQFVRFAALAQARGGRVVVECQPQLLRLLATVSGVDHWVAQGADLPDFDTHVPLLSLPRVLGTTLETVPAAVPYVSPPTTFELPAARPATRKVGLVWAGNPNHKNNRYRSCGLEAFVPLLSRSDCTFYSLQVGPGLAELQGRDELPLIRLDPWLHDFADTAAAIAQLDLVITVDTAVAHLAGAMGKPVWILLHTAPDWRWLLERDDSPWYPTARLFRQQTAGDWASVVQAVNAALQLWHSVVADPPARSVATPSAISLSWPLEGWTDHGILGSYLALTAAQEGIAAQVHLAEPHGLSPLQVARLQAGNTDTPAATLPPSSVVLLGDGLHPVGDASSAAIALVALQQTHLDAAAVEQARQYQRLVTGSTWATEVLRAHGLEPLQCRLQGVDVGVFHPAPKSGLWGDRFVVVAPGVPGLANAPDVMLTAFHQFALRHPDALLLTTGPEPIAASHPAMIHLGVVPYGLMGQVFREADVVLFTSRCESGLSPLSLGSLACGIPTILPAHTGYRDLLQHNLGYPLHAQRPVAAAIADTTIGVDGWGESDPEEILEVLEHIYTQPIESRYRAMAAAECLRDWTWRQQLSGLLAVLQDP